MNNYQKLAKLLNVAEITEDYKSTTDLEIGPWHTADGYEVHVIANDPRNIDFEYDVYYYEPSFRQVIDRIEQLDSDAIVYVSDFEIYLPMYEVEDYIEEQEEKLLENLDVERYEL